MSEKELVVTDIKMPFWSMVVFMIKWSIAAIPAMIIIMVIGALLTAIFGGVITAITGGRF